MYRWAATGVQRNSHDMAPRAIRPLRGAVSRPGGDALRSRSWVVVPRVSPAPCERDGLSGVPLGSAPAGAPLLRASMTVSLCVRGALTGVGPGGSPQSPPGSEAAGGRRLPMCAHGPRLPPLPGAVSRTGSGNLGMGTNGLAHGPPSSARATGGRVASRERGRKCSCEDYSGPALNRTSRRAPLKSSLEHCQAASGQHTALPPKSVRRGGRVASRRLRMP